MQRDEKALLDAIYRALGAWDRYEQQPKGDEDARLILAVARSMVELRQLAVKSHRDLHDAESQEFQR